MVVMMIMMMMMVVVMMMMMLLVAVVVVVVMMMMMKKEAMQIEQDDHRALPVFSPHRTHKLMRCPHDPLCADAKKSNACPGKSSSPPFRPGRC